MSTLPSHTSGQTTSHWANVTASVSPVVMATVQTTAPIPATSAQFLASRHFIAGVMVVPSLSPTPLSSGPPPAPALPITDTELRVLATAQQRGKSPPQNLATLASPSGGTIHHLGLGPLSREGFAFPPTNPAQLSAMTSNQQSNQQQLLQGVVSQLSHQQRSGAQALPRRTSATRLSGHTSPGANTDLSSSSHKVNRTSPLQSPDRSRKRIKLEEIPPATAEIANKRRLICDYKLREIARLKENYKEHLTELFFLQNGGQLMDYFTWKKRPTMQLLHFLKSGSLESEDEDESQEKSINNEVKVLTACGGMSPLTTPVAISTSLPDSVAAAQQDQNKRQGGRHGMVFGHVQPSQTSHTPVMPGGIPLSTTAATTTVGSPPPYSSGSLTPTSSLTTTTTAATPTLTTTTVSLSSTLAKMMMEGLPSNASIDSISSTMVTSSRMTSRPHSISTVYEHTLGSQEAIVERAKQEAQVMQRVSELRKEGLWSARRLPKVQEPPRNKAHWDYLLEEMQWLAADFAQERKWKKAGAKKIARMITRHFQELQQKEIKAEKEEGQKVKRIANNMAKMVKEFWSNIEKVVQYKQNKRLEEKQKKALDLHLSFIVDQTEKYSTWLTEGLSVAGASSRTGSVGSVAGSTPDDGDFEPTRSSESDDEETIELEEADNDPNHTRDEVDALQKESELPLDELLKSLPKEVLENPALGEDNFCSDAEDSEDDEETVAEQEKLESNKDYTKELQELQDEGELTIEELRAKYAGAAELDLSDESVSEDPETESDTDKSQDDESEVEDEEAEDDVGLDFLAQTADSASVTSQESSGPNKELTDIAEAAESIQPTGYTLETTQVKTAIPFLLKHTLREYQHVGLDWLATLHQRKLNGILADEMGLGKTIQTIAVLASLATEWGNWGPHLIVVPTSVMLNWEMEFKKWCPAFKILTYYGNQKERKLKRQGWTKTNAFHVCITSYKLVIQDHQSFRRKKWKYLILDEAQNIKNFKSQRWQTLLNFSSQRRLLLTGTPLQNNLMELWSLMHFLMPHVFQSHKEFKEWFANPLSNMIEGSREYNEGLIKRLHKVLRPFLLRRLKADVEKQMPQKFEHVVMCRLSKRQRFLYDDFMSQTKTKETLASGHFMSVINILMQLRKVCNHPNLFDPRPIQSPFQMEGLTYHTPSLVIAALRQDPLETIDLSEWHPSLSQMETTLSAFAAHRIQKLQTPRPLIEEIDSVPESTPRPQLISKCKPFVFRGYSMSPQDSGRASPFVPIHQQSTTIAKAPTAENSSRTSSPAPSLEKTGEKVSVSSSSPADSKLQSQTTPVTLAATSAGGSQIVTPQPITVQIQQTQQGTRFMIPSGSISQLPAGYIQIVQTSSGQQFIATTSQPLQQSQAGSAVMNGPSTTSTSTATVVMDTVSRPASTVILPTSATSANSGKPVVRVSPLSTESQTASVTAVSTLLSKPTVAAVVRPTPVIANKRATSQRAKIALQKEAELSEFYMPSLAEKRVECREQTLSRLASYNERHCGSQPVYGQDLHNTVNVQGQLPAPHLTHACPWRLLGYIHCCRVACCTNTSHPASYWNQTTHLRSLLSTPDQYLADLKEIIQRFVFVVPPAMAPRIQMHASHPPPSWLQEQRRWEFDLTKQLSPKMAALHIINSRRTVQFPELRLIEYDCGKLQTLDLLLHRLKTGSHRVLIFTQMTRMLDVLEQFLSYHGHRYLRLDGTTKVEQRQVLMDRFNMDKRIFCFILSTRSGGIGVNLTGADTVIFYDSDWNPTMDAQAQDRCHRIGQTRDVHIYRLISQKTVEENILKKANQKRLLGDVAIEGGNFTAAFFKEQTLKDLFEEPSGLDALAREKSSKSTDASKSEPVVVATSTSVVRSRRSLEKRVPSPVDSAAGNLTEDQLEQALGAAEDEPDKMAVRVVKAEQKAELAEFDEEIPWDEREAELKKERDDEMSKVEQELVLLEKELTSIERYAVQYMENQTQSTNEEELQKAEEEVTLAKEEWELGRLQALKEEEERRAELEEDEMLFTYSHEDAIHSQVFISDMTGEHMPMWSPPTPPQDDNDVHMDQSMCFLYEPSVMPESQLPPVFIKKEHKRIRIDPAIAAVVRKQKVRKEEHHRVPRSLFDRPQSLLRKERDIKLMKLKQFAKPLKPQLLQSRPLETTEGHPDWLIHEDWALLQALQMLQELPSTLSTDTPAVIPNWDLVADMVNLCSRTYRSIKQCKSRYENYIVPREEGKILYDINPRKQKKSKGIYKTKNNRPMRTSQLFLQDNNKALTTLYSLRFDSCKAIAAKRTPTIRPTLANPTLKNPKHAAVLAESGINYEQPLTPTQVAGNRAERIAREKQKTQDAQRTATPQTTTVTATATAAQVTQAVAGTVTSVAQPQMTIVQGQPLQTTVSGIPTTVVVTAGSIPKAAAGTTVAAVSLARTLGPTGSIVVNPANANTFAAINKRIAGQTVVGTVAQTLASTSTSSIAQAVRAARVSGVTVQAAVVNQSPARLGAGTAQVITTSALTPAHILAAQKAGTVTVSNISAGAVPQQATLGTAKTLTPQQLQLLRLKQQQLRRMTGQAAQQASQAAIGQTIQKTVGVTTPLITSITPSQVAPARLQLSRQPGLKGTTVTRSLSDAEMTILIKRQQLQQQQQQQKALSGATIVSQGTQGVQQVSQGHVTRLTTAQIIAGAQVQQVQAGQLGTGTSQPVATLVKTVSTQGGSGLPSVTIPVTAAVSLGISVNVPTQKTIAGKNVTHNQMRQIQLAQQLQRKQLQVAQQKVTTLGHLQQVGKLSGGTTPLIIPQQQQALPKVMVQQIIKQQPSQGATIQQIIASTTATVIATQLVTQAPTKLSVPTASLTTAQATRVSAPLTVTAVSAAAQPISMATGTLVSGTPTVTLTASQTTLISPQKTVTLQSAGGQQVKALQQTTAVRQVPGVAQIASSSPALQVLSQAQTVSVASAPKVLQAQPQATVVQQILPPAQTVSQMIQPSAGVQQAVQKVLQESQAQAQQRVTSASSTALPATATVVTATPVLSGPATAQTTLLPQGSVATPGDAQGGKNSPYTMRLRNTRSDSNTK